ncbi:MAG TPA: phosphomannomutase/phosphoglucomutase [Spirochaetales bacterium]|nr:phosphomannomutase/phosphoglucomutase [Spirochaetales bacterium]
MSVFKVNDIRGLYGKEWDYETAFRIGFYLPGLLAAEKILVGRDARLSSPEVFKALTSGILAAGCSVVDMGACATPALYFATIHYAFKGSVMITASHNPPEYNGLKISKGGALPLGYEEGFKRLEELVKVKPEPDGNFPSHGPDPSRPENLESLKKKVKEEGTDLGMCFDGDGDRVVFIDEMCNFVSPDLITAVLGLHYFKHYPEKVKENTRVLYDIRSSRSVKEYITAMGGEAEFCPVGHAEIKRRLRQRGGLFAGELTGHYYFSENHFCDSALIASFFVLSVLSKEGISLSTLISAISKYHYSGEINFQVENKEKVIDHIRNVYGQGLVSSIDGLKIDFPDWWFIIRNSTTESYLRLVLEAGSAEELTVKKEELTAAILAADKSFKNSG